MDASKAWRWLGGLVLLLAALIQTGCLLAVAGAAGAGAAAGYLYYNGLLYRDYHSSLADTISAVRTSLLELEFPLLEEKIDAGTAYMRTRTADGTTVRVYMDLTASPIPIEGSVTRVGIRVGFGGDDAVSARILDQVSRHLVPRALLPAGGPPAPPPAVPPGTTTAGGALPLRPIPVTPATPPSPRPPAATTLGAPRTVAETAPPPLAVPATKR